MTFRSNERPKFKNEQQFDRSRNAMRPSFRRSEAESQKPEARSRKPTA